MPRPLIRHALLAGVFAVGLTGTSYGQDGVAGPYLAARQAGFEGDYAASARYYDMLIQRGGNQVEILDTAMIAYAMLGDFARASRTATKALTLDPDLQLARMVQMVDHLTRGDFTAANAALEAGIVGGPLLDGLMKGWVLLSEGNMSLAVEAFDTLAETRAFSVFAYVHKALAFAMVGDLEGADDILSGRAHGPLRMNATAVGAHAQILSQLDRNADAIALLNATSVLGTLTPELADMQDRLAAGETLPFTLITSPTDGMSEAFTTLAAVVNGEASATYTLLHSRAAIALRPDNVDAILLTSGILEREGQYDLAAQVLDGVPRDHPAFYLAQISRAEVMMSEGSGPAAALALRALAETHGDLRDVQIALADTLRREKDFAGAALAYEAALDLVEAPSQRDWFLYYARAIAYERTDRWDLAEADFRRALELNPDQPAVLNYLGYSLVEQRKNLDEALAMIEKAAAARPDDGFIADSLGWVFYRLGRYPEAVEPMERAVQLEPLDPVINDHLGDVYWAVGRKREAEFQWRRALSNVDPADTNSEAEPDRMRRKLAVGLDVVLAEEGADPLGAAQK
jgi:Flp pilus assembly protein TadD